MTIINQLVTATETEFFCHLPFVTAIIIKCLAKNNYLIVATFPYHCVVTFRITDIHGAWLIFFNRGHLYSYLTRNGMNKFAVVTHD